MGSKQVTNHSKKSVWRWPKLITLFALLALVINHLNNPELFSSISAYRFPIEGFIASLVLSLLIMLIADFNFEYYKKKHFAVKVEKGAIIRFLMSTLGLITLMYFPVNYIFKSIFGGSMPFYFVLIGLLLTLLLSFTIIGIAFAPKLYRLYKFSLKEAELTIESGARTTKLTYENIACFYTENKIVHTVQNDGKTLTTDFTLNELEDKLNDQLFFRANRKIIIHKDAVKQMEKIENGKLRISLKDPIAGSTMTEIIISRYKRQAFINWFE